MTETRENQRLYADCEYNWDMNEFVNSEMADWRKIWTHFFPFLNNLNQEQIKNLIQVIEKKEFCTVIAVLRLSESAHISFEELKDFLDMEREKIENLQNRFFEQQCRKLSSWYRRKIGEAIEGSQGDKTVFLRMTSILAGVSNVLLEKVFEQSTDMSDELVALFYIGAENQGA